MVIEDKDIGATLHFISLIRNNFFFCDTTWIILDKLCKSEWLNIERYLNSLEWYISCVDEEFREYGENYMIMFFVMDTYENIKNKEVECTKGH